MKGARGIVGITRHGAMAALLLALALRAMIPAGWMPSTGSFGLMLCNGTAQMPTYGEIARQRSDGVPFEIAVARAAIERAEGKAPAAPTPEEPHPCAFAGMAPVLPPPVPAALPAPFEHAPAPTPIADGTVAVGRGLAAPPPPATGPPALA